MRIAKLGKVEFELLKQRLLLRRLDETPVWEAHALIMQEAEFSAYLSEATTFPLLVFPCLFAERADAASDVFYKRMDLYWSWLDVDLRIHG